ncbi:hypothetical protein KC19_6G187900 [Ceratodon purpureus]|uniref:Uncharacterized protein n=1 Tax=Ceratodon purpureus TaxID=3225 RepID=A0A8T0HGA1_CERPU|nr:hypothetical protein KC19_6G187900 [Ceratodon purpureus]
MRMDRFELCDHRELRRVWMSRDWKEYLGI